MAVGVRGRNSSGSGWVSFLFEVVVVMVEFGFLSACDASGWVLELVLRIVGGSIFFLWV